MGRMLAIALQHSVSFLCPEKLCMLAVVLKLIYTAKKKKRWESLKESSSSILADAEGFLVKC